jgi:DNA-binding transcriptional MerR regulator
MNTILAFRLDQVQRLTGLSRRQIRYWDDTNFYNPSYHSEKGRPFGRVYSFRDLVGLRTIALLMKEHGFRLQQLRPVAAWLASHPSETWSSLRFYIAGSDLIFEDTELNAWRSTARPRQTVIPIHMYQVISEAESDADRLRERTSDEIGQIVRNRLVSHNQHVLAGTRIRTSAIWTFHEDGYSNDEILRQYPRLVAEDVDAALKFERTRHRAG